MTWTWTITKTGIGIGLGMISSNSICWAINLPISELIKLKGKESLNSSNLTLVDKEKAQRWIEVSSDYQVGASLGIAFKGLGVLANEKAKKLLVSVKKRRKRLRFMNLNWISEGINLQRTIDFKNRNIY